MLIYLYSVMEDGITASLYTYLTDLTVFAKSEGIPMGTHSLHKIERQHIKMPPLGAKVPDPYAPLFEIRAAYQVLLWSCIYNQSHHLTI